MATQKIVSRGYVLVWERLDGEKIVSAIVQHAEVQRMRRRRSGKVVNVEGQAWERQSSTGLRILVDKDFALNA